MTHQTMSRGLWIDDPPKTALNKGYFRSLRDCQMDLIAVMIDRCDEKWERTWNNQQLEGLLKLADEDAIEVVLTTWPYPNKEQINLMANDMKNLLSLGPFAAWEVDLEFNWKASRTRGFRRGFGLSALEHAGNYLVSRAREAGAETQARFEVTSFTQHTENGSKATVAPMCDRMIAQAYSIRNRPGLKKPIPWGHAYGPASMQIMTLDRTLTIPNIDDGKPELGCGLAAWGQRWPNREPSLAMDAAFLAATNYPVVDIRWWSSKHVIGIKKNLYAAKFLEGLAK